MCGLIHHKCKLLNQFVALTLHLHQLLPALAIHCVRLFFRQVPLELPGSANLQVYQSGLLYISPKGPKTFLHLLPLPFNFYYLGVKELVPLMHQI